MRGLFAFTQVVAKILEVLHWVAVGFMAVLFVLSFTSHDLLSGMVVQTSAHDVELSAYRYAIVVIGGDGQLDDLAVRMFSLGAIPVFSLMAMVFRNVCLILKTMQGKTWFSQGETPFQNDVTRMVREIGIFLLSVVGVQLVLSAASVLVLGACGSTDVVESSLNLEMLVLGLLMLCLSSAFSQGESLQKDVDGLI